MWRRLFNSCNANQRKLFRSLTLMPAAHFAVSTATGLPAPLAIAAYAGRGSCRRSARSAAPPATRRRRPAALTPRRRAPCRPGKGAAPTPWRSGRLPEARAGEVLLGAREIAMGKWGRPRGRPWCGHVGEAQEAYEWIVRP